MLRNGKAHDAEDAVNHVQRKYDYFRKKISSTEEFIELSASKSTISGREYQVRCGNDEAVSSRDWLMEELAAYRQR